MRDKKFSQHAKKIFTTSFYVANTDFKNVYFLA